MIDFQIVSAKVELKVQSIAPIRGFYPPSVLIIGSGLDKTKEVLFNDIEAREFIISSPSRLVVRIPESQVGKALRGIRVFSTVPVSRKDAVLELGFPKPMKSVSGMERLVQNWMLIFMSTPGSSIFNPSSGAGGRSIIGRTTDRYGKGVSADLAQAIDKTKTELISIQGKNPRIPLSEKLLSSDLESLNFDSNTATLHARVAIKNMLGDNAEVSVG